MTKRVFLSHQIQQLILFVLIFLNALNAEDETNAPVLIYCDSVVKIKLPDSDTIVAEIIRVKKDEIIVSHPYLGGLVLKKEKFSNSEAFQKAKEWMRKDPDINYTFLHNQTAFITREYPISFKSSLLFNYTIDALLTNRTLLFTNFNVIPHRTFYSLGLKQQLFLKKNGNYALAIYLKYLNTINSEVNYYENLCLGSNPITIAGSLGIINSFKRNSTTFNIECSYLFSKNANVSTWDHYVYSGVGNGSFWWHYESFPVGYDFSLTHQCMFKMAIDWQFAPSAKIFLEDNIRYAKTNDFSNYFTLFFRSGLGFKFLLPRATINFGTELTAYAYFNPKYVEPRMAFGQCTPLVPLPFISATVFLGPKKTIQDNN